MDHGRVRDLLESVLLLKLSVRISLGVLMADSRNLCEILSFGAVPGNLVSSSYSYNRWCRTYFSMYSRPALAKY